jgi:thiol-disulfide isomerase/thioredoxin
MAFRSYRAPSFNFSQYRGTGGRVLQRRCACGNKAESEGECTQCAEKQGMLQRKERGGGPNEVPSIVHDVLRAPGQPLDDESQNFMEARFGYDFSGVRVHADEQAHRSADATNADAYTVGQDIVFASGRYAPQTPTGRQLLAHELTHVVQQSSAPSSGPITMGKSDDYETNADRAAADVIAGRHSVSAIQSTGVNLQRQPAAGTATTTAATKQPCLEAVVGEDIPSLMQAGVLTIIEFGAEWCKPCKQLQADLGAICERFRLQPPPVTVRFYSIDIEAPGNEEASAPYVGGGVPHLYFFVGSSEKAHYNSAPQPDVLDYIVAEQIEYASTSGAARGAKKGLGWGALAGGLAGIGGAIAIGTQSNLEGNDLMGAVLGTIVGGAAVGLGLGAAIGAIAGAASDDRNTGPKQQKRKKLQKKSRSGDSSDREEREADLWASHVVHSNSQSIDTATRGSMERQFDRDFSHVRIHRDEPAQSFARELDAYAVTRGSDIYFAADGYAPGTPFGRSVLGHELAHVAQNDFSGPTSGLSTLETEAAQASQSVAAGGQPTIQHGSNQSALAMTRAEHTAASTGVGVGGGAALGAGIGLIAASQFSGKDKPFGEAAGIGAAIGGGLGLIGGLLYGIFARNTDPESTAEAEGLIQKYYGKYLRGGASGPLHNAVVNPVTQPEICERMRCRGFPCGAGYVGWTDTGVPIQPAAGPQNQKAPLPDQASEPTCNGKQMTHATPERPVIYYVRESKYAGTLIHEGLHAHSHPDFIYLHRHLNEGVTEYFTRKLQDEINMPYVENSYDDEVKSAEKLVSLVGEERVAQAYFGGAMPALHQAFNSQFGQCALITWAFHLEGGSEMRAATLLENRNQNYCEMMMSNTGVTNAELTPSPPPEDPKKPHK